MTVSTKCGRTLELDEEMKVDYGIRHFNLNILTMYISTDVTDTKYTLKQARSELIHNVEHLYKQQHNPIVQIIISTTFLSESGVGQYILNSDDFLYDHPHLLI